MLTETEGKGGCVCAPARRGELKCPLIVRPTSEDVLTGNLFGGLANVNPTRWLPQILNRALDADRFRPQVFRDFRIDLWRNRPPYPTELLPWREGSTQVDVTIRWENPPTTIYFEVKYLSPLSPRTTNDDGSSGYPSDQLIRNIRVGLHECGWFAEQRLFAAGTRDFAVVLLGPRGNHPLTTAYRDPERLPQAVPHFDRLSGLPRSPFVGELTFGDFAAVLRERRRFGPPAERRLTGQLADYLDFKAAHAIRRPSEPVEEVAP